MHNYTNNCRKEKEPCQSTALDHKMYVGFSGGDDGNRTRVRKPIHTTFYGCSLFFTFPCIIVNKHTMMLGSLQYTARTQALSCGVHHWSTPYPKPWYSSARRAAIKQLLIQNYCCRLILKRAPFKEICASLPAYHASKSPSKPLHPHK